VGPSIIDHPGGGVVARIPITFLGMAQGRQDFVPGEFIGNPRVVQAVQSIRNATTSADRLAAVNDLMENLG
jgi:hypothetical protein